MGGSHSTARRMAMWFGSGLMALAGLVALAIWSGLIGTGHDHAGGVSWTSPGSLVHGSMIALGTGFLAFALLVLAAGLFLAIPTVRVNRTALAGFGKYQKPGTFPKGYGPLVNMALGPVGLRAMSRGQSPHASVRGAINGSGDQVKTQVLGVRRADTASRDSVDARASVPGRLDRGDNSGRSGARADADLTDDGTGIGLPARHIDLEA